MAAPSGALASVAVEVEQARGGRRAALEREPRRVAASRGLVHTKTEISQDLPRLCQLAQHFDCRIPIRGLTMAQNLGQRCKFCVQMARGLSESWSKVRLLIWILSQNTTPSRTSQPIPVQPTL